MDNYSETFKTWNKVASLYQEKFMDLDLYDESYDFVCNSLPIENSNLLDVGCGPGNITKYFLKKRPDLHVWGIDIAPNMIELAMKNNPTADFKVMDIRQIHEIETKFDAVICGFCMPYLSQSDVAKLIVDSVGLLKAQGLIYISFVEGDPSKSGYVRASTGDQTFFYYHKLDSILEHLQQCTFEILKSFKVNFEKSNKEKEEHVIVIAKRSKVN